MLLILKLIFTFLLSRNISVFTCFLCLNEKTSIEFQKQASLHGLRLQIYEYNTASLKPFLSHQISEAIVLNLKCCRVREIISNASISRGFDNLHTWLVVDETEDTNLSKIKDIFTNILILPDSDVVWLSKTELLDVFTTKLTKNVIVNTLYKLSNNTNVEDLMTVWRFQPSRTSRRKNLQNISLKATTIISQPQFFKGWEDLNTKHIDTWPKVTHPIMENLSHDLNYSVNMKQTDNYGALQKDGKFDGLSGQLQREEIEFGATSMFMRKDRWDVLDYCAETIVLKSSFMFRQPPQSTVNNIFILPFTYKVWLVCLFTFVLIGLFLTILSNKVQFLDPRLSYMNFPEVFSFTIGAICQQGTSVNTFLVSARIVMLFSFITSMFIFTSYSAKIVAILQSPSTSIRTVSDLAKSPMTFGLQETAYKNVYFTESNDPKIKYLYKHKIAPQGENVYMSVVEGIKRVKKNLFAFQVETSSGFDIISQTYTEREKCGLAEIEAFKLPMVAVPIKKKSGYRDLFASRLRWQREIGLIDRIKKIWISQKPICHEGGTGFVSISIAECLPAFQVLGFGAILSLIICASEIIWHRCYLRQPNDFIIALLADKSVVLIFTMRHSYFLARTAFVQNGNVEEAFRVVNRILGKEGILTQYRMTRYYEKPFQTRRRVNHERCKAIYNEDMDRKIQFVLRKNRAEPFPGCH